MSSQSVDQLQRSRIPKLYLTVIAGSGQHVFIGMKRKCQNITTMMIGILTQTEKLLLFGFAVPLNDTLILRARIHRMGCDLEGSDTESMSFRNSAPRMKTMTGIRQIRS